MLDSVVRPAGGSVPLWSAALIVQRGGFVVSPADAEIYRRVAATGSSNADPANDIDNYAAASYERFVGFPPAFVFHSSSSPGRLVGGTRIASGSAIAVGTRTLALSTTGRGELSHLSMQVSPVNYAGVSGARVEIVVDGKTLYDADVAGNVACYLNVFGNVLPRWNDAGSNNTDYIAMEAAKPIQFRRSLQIFFTPTGTAWAPSNGLIFILRRVA